MSAIAEVLSTLKPKSLDFDFAKLAPDLRAALPFLAEAVEQMNELYLLQQSEQSPALRKGLTGADALAFDIFKGPWNPFEDHKSFLGGKDRPKGCAFYPEDMTRDEFDAYVSAHPEVRQAFYDPNTVIRRKGAGLEAIPYSVHFEQLIGKVASALDRAAELIEHRGLSSFLRGRSAALRSNTYQDSDAAWVRLTDTPMEIVLGPYEVYDDGLAGLKAAFEGFLFAVDAEEGARLREIERNLSAFSKAIPCPAGSKPSVGGMAPIMVVDELLAAGDAYAGILASAFNLPNDPEVRGKVGWKQVMIRNVMRAKFETCTLAIGERILSAPELASFDAYFALVLFHEICHGLGPAFRADGAKVNEACGPGYMTIEETKADTGAVCLMLKFGGRCGVPAFDSATIWASVIAGIFRSMRFGLHEAHGGANAIKLNWMKEQGALHIAPTGRYEVNFEKADAAAFTLLDRLTELQASGTKAEIDEFIARYAKADEATMKTLSLLQEIPVDIIPIFPIYQAIGRKPSFQLI